MNYDELWTNITALFPSNVDLTYDGATATVKSGDKEITVIYNDDNSFVVDGKTLHFEDTMFEVINTLLVPYILQELDGERRL